MSKIEQLTCPACGAHDVSQISGINYQCNYCHSTFMVKEDNPFSKFNKTGKTFTGLNKEELLEKLRKGEMPFSTDFTETIETAEKTETFYTKVEIPTAQNIPVVKPTRLAGIIIGVVVIALVGVGVSVFTLTNNAVKNNKAFFGAWQKPSVQDYDCLAGTRGAAVWLILQNQTNKLDSVKYQVRVIDPKSNTILAEQLLDKVRPWKDLFDHSKNFDSEFYTSNDTVYNISEDGGIQGFDLYTGKRLFGNEWLENKFPQLKDGISKIEKDYRRKQLKITSASGDDFIYYLDSKQLLSEKEAQQLHKQRSFSEDIYLSDEKKSKLYLCNMERDADDDFYIRDYYIEAFSKKNNNSYSNVKEIKPLGDAVYAKALPLKKYNNDLLFFYASDFSKHANGVLALVNKEGNFLWKNSDPAFKKIIAKSSDNSLYFKYSLQNDLLVITLNGSPHESIGIDLKTGKTQFDFTQSSSLD